MTNLEWQVYKITFAEKKYAHAGKAGTFAYDSMKLLLNLDFANLKSHVNISLNFIYKPGSQFRFTILIYK